jgi:hypothetical protein
MLVTLGVMHSVAVKCAAVWYGRLAAIRVTSVIPMAIVIVVIYVAVKMFRAVEPWPSTYK